MDEPRKKGGFSMKATGRKKRWVSCLLCLLLLALPVLALASQSYTCPEAGLTLTLPDDFELITLTQEDDPDLCLLLESKKMSVSVYVSFVGSAVTDPQSWLLTGDETDTGTRKIAGKKVDYVSGNADGTSYYTCFWLYQGSGASLDFRWTGKQGKKILKEILSSIEWLDE